MTEPQTEDLESMNKEQVIEKIKDCLDELTTDQYKMTTLNMAREFACRDCPRIYKIEDLDAITLGYLRTICRELYRNLAIQNSTRMDNIRKKIGGLGF